MADRYAFLIKDGGEPAAPQSKVNHQAGKALQDHKDIFVRKPSASNAHLPSVELSQDEIKAPKGAQQGLSDKDRTATPSRAVSHGKAQGSEVVAGGELSADQAHNPVRGTQGEKSFVHATAAKADTGIHSARQPVLSELGLATKHAGSKSTDAVPAAKNAAELSLKNAAHVIPPVEMPKATASSNSFGNKMSKLEINDCAGSGDRSLVGPQRHDKATNDGSKSVKSEDVSVKSHMARPGAATGKLVGEQNIAKTVPHNEGAKAQISESRVAKQLQDKVRDLRDSVRTARETAEQTTRGNRVLTTDVKAEVKVGSKFDAVIKSESSSAAKIDIKNVRGTRVVDELNTKRELNTNGELNTKGELIGSGRGRFDVLAGEGEGRGRADRLVRNEDGSIARNADGTAKTTKEPMTQADRKIVIREIDRRIDDMINREIKIAERTQTGKLANMETRRVFADLIDKFRNGEVPVKGCRDTKEVIRAIRELGPQGLRDLRNLLLTKPVDQKFYEGIEPNKARQYHRFLEVVSRNYLGEKKEAEPKSRLEQLKERLAAQVTDRASCIVKQGQTLISIAWQQLKDSKLWPVIANVNGFPQNKDAVGKPLFVPKPGQIILLPKQEEIEQFRKQQTKENAFEKAPITQGEKMRMPQAIANVFAGFMTQKAKEEVAREMFAEKQSAKEIIAKNGSAKSNRKPEKLVEPQCAFCSKPHAKGAKCEMLLPGLVTKGGAVNRAPKFKVLLGKTERGTKALTGTFTAKREARAI